MLQCLISFQYSSQSHCSPFVVEKGSSQTGQKKTVNLVHLVLTHSILNLFAHTTNNSNIDGDFLRFEDVNITRSSFGEF